MPLAIGEASVFFAGLYRVIETYCSEFWRRCEERKLFFEQITGRADMRIMLSVSLASAFKIVFVQRFRV